jgi:hypothetical protein
MAGSRVLGLKILRVQGKGAEPTPEVGWASRPGLTGPVPFRPGSVALLSRGSSGDYELCPFHLHDFNDFILVSKMEVLHA